MLYPNLCYNKVCYKGTALYIFDRESNDEGYCGRS